MKETNLQKQIRLFCGKRDWLCFHTNVGGVKTDWGGWFQTGLPKGWPDLMILTNNGVAMFCETKVEDRIGSKEQKEKIQLLNNRGFKAFFANSLEEFINEIDN